MLRRIGLYANIPGSKRLYRDRSAETYFGTGVRPTLLSTPYTGQGFDGLPWRSTHSELTSPRVTVLQPLFDIEADLPESGRYLGVKRARLLHLLRQGLTQSLNLRLKWFSLVLNR